MRLHEVLGGQIPSYIAPLFWQHGESETVLRDEIQKMSENGIGGFIVESRPHPDFLGQRWWHDLDVLLEEAGKRGMKVWLFDDKTYPSGFSAGMVKDAHPEYLKVYLAERHIDPIGPLAGSSFRIQAWLGREESLVRVIAARRTDGVDGFDSSTLVDLTGRITDGILYWDVPAGDWRIYLFICTRNGGEEWTRDYVNPLVPEAVQAYLDFVYEAHYRRYPQEFGHTLAGFFSDEPRFGNAPTYEASIGRYNMVLPYSPDLLAQLDQAWQGDFGLVLPCLWYEGGAGTQHARYTFMDMVSRLFGEHFSQKIGDWCRAHGVQLIGHIVEDNGAHARLGYGPGHFFRAISGQDVSGMDLVYQVWPGYHTGRFTTPFGYLHADFFYWGIGKMASSAGHLDPKKKGVTVCEVFGAYGWQEGLKLMKWLTDFITVRGVNFLIPHAFSPRANDPDCPPHFYSRGENPQWRYFHIWSEYTNRVCHLLSGGTHVAPAAVLYHAEAEWSGDYEPFEKVVKVLARRQIDCDVMPMDLLVDETAASVQAGCLHVSGERYSALVIPYAERLPERLITAVTDMARQGLPVLFSRSFPSDSTQGGGERLLAELRAEANCCAGDLINLPDLLAKRDLLEVTASSTQEDLRVYHYRHLKPEPEEIFFLTNENRSQPLATQLRIRLPGYGRPVVYDALQNRVIASTPVETDGWWELPLRLEPYNSLMVAFGPVGLTASESVLDRDLPIRQALETGWQVQACRAAKYPQFQPVSIAELGNAAVPGKLPTFSGTLRYAARFTLDHLPEGPVVLDLGEVYETAEVWVNSTPAGVRICPPYRFDISDRLSAGENTVWVDVTNTFAKERGDNDFDRAMPQEPSGLLGPVFIRYR
jgi:hypothetical protein